MLRKTIVHVDELPPGMGQAVGQDRLQFARQVARQGIAHLDRRRQLRSTELEHPGQILTRVLAAAKEQGHPVTVACAATTPEVNRPVRWSASAPSPSARASASGPPRFPISSRILTVVSSLCSTSPWAACRINSAKAGATLAATARTMSHWVEAGRGISRCPCRPSRRLNGNPLPYFKSPIMLPAVASYFRLPVSSGRRGGKHLAAQVATQFLQLINRRRQRRLPGDSHHHTRSLFVDDAFTAGGTRVAGR